MRTIRFFIAVAVLGAIIFAAYGTQSRWMPLLAKPDHVADVDSEAAPAINEPKVLKISAQARKNLGLVSKAVKPREYWETVQIPGVVVDRPGVTDRKVTAPVVGVVAEVSAHPGDTVRPGERLFLLRLTSEYLQNTQKQLYQAGQEIQLLDAQLARLRPLLESGSISGAKIIEIENERRRQDAIVEAQRQDLSARGFTEAQVGEVEAGHFVTSIEVVAPPSRDITSDGVDASSGGQPSTPAEQLNTDFGAGDQTYEVQALAADLGQQVQAGQLLATLANHASLYIEGHAFKSDAPALARATKNEWMIDVEFTDDSPESWPSQEQHFHIRHLANSIDVENRTFDFYLPLANQSQGYEHDGKEFVIWRYRPGQRVRLHVPVATREDVLVLPSDAVVREGPEAYVFQQNGDLFTRLPVQILHEDRRSVVLANDGSVPKNAFLAQSSAASLNRVMKAQAASGMRADVHVHADGTVHASH